MLDAKVIHAISFFREIYNHQRSRLPRQKKNVPKSHTEQLILPRLTRGFLKQHFPMLEYDDLLDTNQ